MKPFLKNYRPPGFTLVEILVVMALIGILAAIVIPNYSKSSLRAKEVVLKENLFHLRDCIGKFYFDKKKYPSTLEELVSYKYLREVPMDPIRGSRDWGLVYQEPDPDEAYDPQMSQSIVDVKSLSDKAALDGSTYSDW